MGNSKSHQFSTLLSPLRAEDYQILSQHQSYQLWQRRSDGRRFMAYPLNEALIDSPQKLQLFNFRKLNHSSLIAIDCILSNEEEYLCSFPKTKQILVENIPFTLGAFRRALNLSEAMTILSAAFAGYNTLNYVYGPLFTSEQMIGFTDQGIPKVWVNPNYSSNEPSTFAVSGSDLQAASLEERTYSCVQKLFDVVQLALAGGYPPDFRHEAAQVASFAEGEELVENYCRQRAMPLDDRISLGKSNKVEPLTFRTETHLQSERAHSNAYPILTSVNTRAIPSETKHELSTYLPTQFSSQHPTPYHQSYFYGGSQVSITHRPMMRSSMNGNNAKVHFVFNTAANSILVENRTTDSPMIIPVTQQKNEATSGLPQSIPPPESHNQSLITSEHSKNDQKISALPVFEERPHISTVQSREQIQLHALASHPESEQHSHQQQQQQQQQQLMVREVVENEQKSENEIPPSSANPQHEADPNPNPNPNPQGEINRVPTSESVEEQGIATSIQSDYRHSQPFDQLKKWEESLLKLSNKQKQEQSQRRVPKVREHYDSSDEQYLSEQRDKVVVQPPPQRQVHLFTNENQLECYIRNKYRHYFQSDEGKQSTALIDQVKQPAGIDSSSYFNQNYDVYQAQEAVYELPQPLPKQSSKQSYEEVDQRKYTFGKIQIDPASAKQQYNKAVEKEVAPRSRVRKLKGSIELNSFEDRYSKYVRNREGRSTSRFNSNISSILKPDESSLNVQKRDFLVQEYLQDSIKENQVKPTPKASERSGLTYDKLRELLWA